MYGNFLNIIKDYMNYNLQNEINGLYLKKTGIPLEAYHTLLNQCVINSEFTATVFVYDHLLNSGLKATDETFKIIEPLHSKTLPESNKIYLKPTLEKHLAPRRRIHKIMKGHNYSSNYENAKIYLPKVKAFLSINHNFKTQPRITLAKTISNGCNISFNDARYIITCLKREGYLNSMEMDNKMKKNKLSGQIGNPKSLDHFFKVTSN